ncbi:hypothetical protein B0H14DRAFT_2559213 [Mycena olivaceomarginata]|nr:hypothetical protein B0H14DRAFT_2559213 [Mycena olivaceomarginata]
MFQRPRKHQIAQTKQQATTPTTRPGTSPQRSAARRGYLLEGACFKVRQTSGLPIPSIPYLHSTIIKPCMDEIALQESDKVMNDPRLKVRLKDCILNYIRNILNPRILPGIYLEDAPYTWGFLLRAQKGAKAKVATPVEPGEWEETPNGSSDNGATFAGETGGFWKDMGFACNVTFALVFVISIMAFTRKTGTNVFPMILDLFLEIGGTSSRILNTLSNAGACVSITTIERLKRILSEDAVAHAINLIQGSHLFYIIFDNINIFLQKSQQWLFNKNTMIHATNVAVISLPKADPSADDLEAKKKRRGKCAAATCTDIVPTDGDEAKMFSSFVGLEWEGRDAMLKAAEDMIASDRQLLPQSTDGRPAGVFNFNEGSKKGIIKMLKKLQGFNWLTSNNIWGARRDRMDNINNMERYVEELSALWHFALNATQMIMRLHFGDSVLDPGSLARHKGLLKRTWNAEKPNYADGCKGSHTPLADSSNSV